MIRRKKRRSRRRGKKSTMRFCFDLDNCLGEKR